MERSRIHRKIAGSICVIIILLISAVTVAVLLHHSSHKTPHQVNAKMVQFSKGVIVDFPCQTHVTQLGSTGGNTVSSADCQAPQSTPYDGYVYTALYQNFSHNRQGQLADYNYCTAQTTYHGIHKGSIMYVTNPQTITTASGKTFSTCVLSAEKGAPYEVLAVAMNGTSDLSLQIDASYSTNSTVLQSDMHAFILNVKSY